MYYSPRSETRLRMRTSTDNVEVSATTSLRGTKIFSTRPRRTPSLSETHLGASAMEKKRPHPRQPNPLRTHHCGERTSSHFLLSMEPAKEQCLRVIKVDCENTVSHQFPIILGMGLRIFVPPFCSPCLLMDI